MQLRSIELAEFEDVCDSVEGRVDKDADEEWTADRRPPTAILYLLFPDPQPPTPNPCDLQPATCNYLLHHFRPHIARTRLVKDEAQ